MLTAGVPKAPDPPTKAGGVEVNCRLVLPTPGVVPRPLPRTSRTPLVLLEVVLLVRAAAASVAAPPLPGVSVIVFAVNELRVKLPTDSVTPPPAPANPMKFRLPPPRVKVASATRLATGAVALSRVRLPPKIADGIPDGKAPVPVRARLLPAPVTATSPANGWAELSVSVPAPTLTTDSRVAPMLLARVPVRVTLNPLVSSQLLRTDAVLMSLTVIVLLKAGWFARNRSVAPPPPAAVVAGSNA